MFDSDSFSDGIDKPGLCIALGAPWREAWFFDELDSTQTWAAERVQAGQDLCGMAVITERQTKGRGRAGDFWSSEAGGFYATAILPRAAAIAPRHAGWLPLAAALACAEFLEAEFGVAAQIKWPNDVLVEGKKIAGLLGETIQHIRKAESPVFVEAVMLLGIGLNWRNIIPANVPIRFPATSLIEHFPQLNDAGRIDFLRGWLQRVGELHSAIGAAPETVLKQLRLAAERRLWNIGRQVRLDRTEQGVVEGRLLGLNELGGARLKLENGSESVFYCGWHPPAEKIE